MGYLFLLIALLAGVTKLDNNRYLLEIEIESAKGSRKHFIVEFEIPEIERK